MKLCWTDTQYGDKVISQYRLFLENDAKQHHGSFKNFNGEDTLHGEFFFSIARLKVEKFLRFIIF